MAPSAEQAAYRGTASPLPLRRPKEPFEDFQTGHSPIEATPQKRPLGALGTMFALERLVRRRTRRRVLDRIGQPPAITGRWRSGQDFPRWIALGDRFTAANLNPALARPGHKPSLVTQSG